jgi:hypothetical protein
MISKKAWFITVLTILCTYLFTSFFLIKDYGITWDAYDSFILGHKYLNFYTTGYNNLDDKQPEIKDHFPNHTKFLGSNNAHQLWWTISNILSASTCYIFFQTLKWYNDIEAHNIIIPIITFLFLLLLFFLVRIFWGNLISLVTILSIITFPRFFGHTFNNIKDVPAIFLFSITMLLFAQWIQNGKTRWLYATFFAGGLAFANKLDAIFFFPIIFLWIAPYIYKKIKIHGTVEIRTLLHFFVGFCIVSLMFIASFPQLLPWFYTSTKTYIYQSLKFLLTLASYARGIGMYPDCKTFNMYAPKQILYTTPLIMLMFFFIGLFYVIKTVVKQKKYKQPNINTLLLIWVLLPVLRHCLPCMRHYDGLRHFLIFIVPFSIIVGIGIKRLTFIPTIVSILLLTLPNMYAIISTHPYQTTYYNAIAGGLQGAQRKNIPFSYDYWLNSTKQAIKWINQHHNTTNKKIKLSMFPFTSILECYKTPYNFNTIKLHGTLPHNTYLIHIPRKERRHPDHKHRQIETYIHNFKDFKSIHTIKSQNGIIATIYYNG